ncbi:MAG: hypothetical protein K9K32_02785 [Halanaerobiales bacterium]|nr:hypothetical protein [Halanaerobiales bacterium]
MGLFDNIKNIFTTSSDSQIVKVFLKDSKCGNKMKVVLRKGYDIQRIYDDNVEGNYQVRKVIVCDKCYNNVVIDLKFDRNYNIIDKNIEDGQFITEEEFDL